MKSKKLRGVSAPWIVAIIAGAILFVALIVALLFLGLKYMQSSSETKEVTATESTKTATAKTTATKVAPAEEPVQSAENFFGAIFDSFSGASVDLAGAKKYLSAGLASQVNDTKESYWDLHGYIHSGPCSASFSEVSNDGTSAVVQISTEWGSECMGMEEPYYNYEMSNSGGRWVIDEIEQLQSSGYSVPRDF